MRLFVEHIELDMCVQFQVNQTHSVRGVFGPQLERHHLVDWAHFSWEAHAHLTVTGQSFMFLAHSSQQQDEPLAENNAIIIIAIIIIYQHTHITVLLEP